ncbi:hypothetical protein CSAL01_09470 [Colletotrichum salicis]|uniref:EC34 protein n=1 Tax=Colletotrichum salicis TaxID=1209931 RepID=A0A135UZ84_9PEZI|nr:hypothetical protein CSAL01_09470 [Colletotrichum salicis]
MRATTFTAVFASLLTAAAAVPQGFSCKSEGFCTYSDHNCNFCLNIDAAAKIKVCQAIDPTYKSAPGDITRGPSGVSDPHLEQSSFAVIGTRADSTSTSQADFQCVVTCCH